MSYKTVLIHLNNEHRARRLIQVGIEIATRFDAHLVGLHVFPAFRLTPPLPLPLGGEIAAQIRGSIKKEDESIRDLFDELTRHQPFPAHWHSITWDRQDPARVVTREAHSADVVVASQADPNWQFSDLLDFPDRLAMGCGRPVIVVPTTGRATGVPGNISIAWRNSRESARAIADAMPLIKLARRVHLMSVQEGPDDAAGYGLDEVEENLKRHGVVPVVARFVATEYTVGEEIRVRAIDENADMLVMGCYGHSRLREFALGGVTRHLLREMTLPVMLSH